jgi:hypothetical protein
MKAPSVAGKYHGFFRLCNSSSQIEFGEKVWISCIVEERVNDQPQSVPIELEKILEEPKVDEEPQISQMVEVEEIKVEESKAPIPNPEDEINIQEYEKSYWKNCYKATLEDLAASSRFQQQSDKLKNDEFVFESCTEMRRSNNFDEMEEVVKKPELEEKKVEEEAPK